MSEEVPREEFVNTMFMDAIKLVNLIKNELPQHYRSFLNILHDYNQRRISMDESVNRINVLFRGHAGLLDLISLFLPHGYRVEARIVPLPDEDDSGPGVEE